MSKMSEAFDTWMDHDGWQFADREAAWKWMYEAGYQAAIAAMKEGGPVAYFDVGFDGYIDLGSDLEDEQVRSRLGGGKHKLYKLPEDTP